MSDVGAFGSDPQSREHPRRERALAALAERQHGVVGLGQLLELGVGRGAVKHRLATRRLNRIHTGVYAVGHGALGTKGRLMAAVLACGPGAVLSHHDAAWLWDLKPPSSATVHVTVMGRRRHLRDGVVVHRARRLAPEDCTACHGIPATTAERTLLDLAEVLRPRQLLRILEEAERLRCFDLGSIDRVCERNPGRRGLRPLRGALGHEIADRPTRSELEARFADLCRAEGLPAPAVNAFVEGFEVDAVWPDRRLAVELDSYTYHAHRGAFEHDRERDAALQRAGYRVLRITWRRLTTEPGTVARDVCALLAGT